MVLSQLKSDIKEKNLKDSFFLFLCKDGDHFLAEQYSKEISKILNRKISYIDNIDSYITPQISLFGEDPVEELLNIYVCSEFTIVSDKLKFAKNLIIITDKISPEVNKLLDYSIAEFPKLENWMVQDYAYVKGEGIDKEDINLFLEMCSYNIYRVENELDKLKNFGKTQRKYLFKQMVQEGAFSDLTSYNIFSLTNAIQSRDIPTINKILSSSMEIEPLALISLLCQNFKKMLLVWFDRNPTPENTGLKSNQILAIRNLPRNYSKEQLVKTFKFLTSLDLELKKGNLPNDDLTSYMIGKILSF